MNQSCINVKAIPNFKFLADHHKISEGTLEEIIYKYRIDTSNEDAMPTSTYIQAQLGKMQYVDINPNAKKIWDKYYSNPKEFASTEKLQQAVVEVTNYFPTNAIVQYVNDKGHKTIVVKEPVQKIIPKHRKDFQSWQEYNDYLLVMGDLIPTEARDKEEQKIGKQPFTFKDGTVITVPFRPNSQQEEALNAMNDFLNSNETAMTLSGYAGTGKTSLMEIIAQKAKKEGRSIVFSASTNKAAAVLRDRVKSAGFTANTLNKVFGISVEVDNRKPYDANNLVNKLREANITPGTVVVIDEASMINEENFKILNGIAEQNDLKIIYVGDKGQLAPVNENQVSKVFRNKKDRLVTLTKVERTDDNAILKEATNIRNGESLSGESSFNKEGKGVAYVKKSNKNAVKAIVERFVPYLKKNPDYFRILAYRNDTVANYNEAVRKTLGYNDNTPRVNEPIVGYNNWGYVWDRNGGTYRFINSEAYKVTKVDEPVQRRWTLNGSNIYMTAIPVVIEDSMGKTQSIDFMDIKGNIENRKNALILAREKKKLFNQAMAMSPQNPMRQMLLNQVNDIEEFLFVNDNIIDPEVTTDKGNHPTLQKKVFDFGYAMTVHKSQGSTFTHVLMDDADIATAKNTNRNSWNSVEIGNPEEDYIGEVHDEASMDVKESGNLFDLMNQPNSNATILVKPSPSQDNNNINLRQQLEYVAVSRATDTVTVIANDANVKKEDTPLNHVKASTNSAPSAVPQPVAIENTPKPVDQMNKRELWEHLESLVEPMGERPVSYTPKGKARQEYIVKDGKVYNKKDEEVHYQGKDMNKILANLAVAEDRGVVVTYKDNDYVVDNHQNITSVQTGDIMKWGPQDGNRKAIIQLAEQKFQTLIENRQNRLSEMVPELMDLLKAQGININDKDAMEKFLKKNPQWSTKIQQFIGKKARTQFEQQLMKARPDMATPGYTVDGINFIKDPFSDDFIPSTLDAVTAQRLQKEGIIKEGVFSAWALTDKGKEMAQISHPEIDAALDFLHSLEDNKENTVYIKTAIRWIANKSLTLPQDHTKAYQAFELARKKHLDLQKYNTLGELITAPEMQPKEKEKAPFNPDKAKTFSNKRTVTTEGGRVFTVYDVENTEEGQREVCKALAAHYEMSPWCLSTFTATGEPTESARNYWHEYEGIKRRIAFENGKPVAFSSDHGAPKRYWLEIDGKELPTGIRMLNNLGQNMADGVGSKEFSPETLDYLTKNGYVERNPAYDWVIDDDAYKLTNKGLAAIKEISSEAILEDREAWWDMEDQRAQGSLSDSIVSEPRKQLTMEEEDPAMAEYLRQENMQQEQQAFDDMMEAWNRMTPEERAQAEENYEYEDIPFMQTSEGEIYGFADQKGDLYFDEDKVSPNVQLHEYTHLWDRAVAQRNPKLWKRGVDLMKKTSLWNEVLNEANYGQKWKAVKGMTSEKIESLIASEVHSRLTGTQGEALLNRIAKEKGSKGIVAKLKQWIFDFWKELKKTFSNWSDEEINKLTLDDFTKMTVRDLIDKINLNEQQQTQQSTQQSQQQVVGENISSKGSAFAKRLTNPFNNETVEFRGTKFDNAEHAYQTWRSGKFDQKGFDAHGGKIRGTTDYSSNYQTMVEILTAKLEQHPDLVEGIAERGGEAYLKASTHDVIGDKYWETKTGQNKFIAALTEAYKSVTPQQATTPEDSSSGITVQLPGYEYFNDLYEDTTVDAEWKVPILQDLDSQLSTENTEQENDNILNQMTRVMEATSEEDYQKSPTAERQEVNDKMSDYWRRNNQMNALMDNEVGLTASEVREVAEDVVNFISDIISEIQSDPEKIKEYFPTLNITEDLSTVTRKKIVQAVNINNLVKEAKRRFEDIRYNENNQEAYDLYANSFELMDQADLILENWDTIMELAADVFVVNEGFSIKRDTKRQSFKTADREFTGYDYDNFTDPQDEDAIREQEDEQEHWQVEARTIDAFNSMSDLVRLAYHNCYELDKNNNKILNKWGIPRRVNKVTAVAKTLRWTQGAMDINQMVEKLSQKEAKNPWIGQLIKRLTDTTGKEADFQSQFFGVMHRHFQLYSIGQLENGIYTSKTLNNHIALSEIMKGINAQFQLKGHPLFNTDGSVKADSLKELKKWYKELDELIGKYNIKFNNGKYTSNNPISDTDVDIAAKNLAAVSRMLGYVTSEESIKNIVTEDSLHKMWSKLGFAINNLEKAGKNYDPFNFEADNNIRSEVMGFLTPIIEELEDAATNAFFDNGKMYQSYVIPSFLTQLFDQFKQSDETFYQWMDKFYGESEWFKNSDGTWRLNWLEQMSRDSKAREIFDHKVQLNFNKHDYMRNMSPEEFTLSVFMEYFSERLNNKDLEHTPAWFRVPIQSNKPSSEFIKFYTDRSPNYKEHIVSKMYDMFLQELSRIDTVKKRDRITKDEQGNPTSHFIASFDENGKKFQFLPWLNPFLEDNTSRLGKLLQKKLEAETKLSDNEEAELMTLVQDATRDFMQQRADKILQNWEDTGILKAAEKIKGVKSLNNSVKDNIENFLWNDFFAANSILQLTIVDKAFYPHATELQKRLAELHAPGTRGNKYATDYEGNSVSDGFYRTILINDLKGFTANIIDNIATVFDKKIAAAPAEEKASWMALKESLVGEKGAYRRINVTDGQAYSSPSSYRKKAFMFGKWSRKAEDIYKRLLKRDFSITDLEVAFQPLKPFVYGHVTKDMGVDVAPISKMPIPFQAKNSEYLLILADALTRGEETGRPNLLKAIFDIMEESHYDAGHYGEADHYRSDGIDTIQFDSAIKSGNQAVIDITPFLTMEGGEAGAYTLMKKLVFQDSTADDLSNYNYTYVHKTDYDNYALQQEVPAHFREHSQAEGSQQRMNIPTDLDFTTYEGAINYYTWKDPDGTEHKMNAKEFRQEYEKVHAANIEDSFNTLAKELHLNSSDKKARNLVLSEILQDEIISSPRYGIDLFIACQIDPATGEFRIPKGDPIQGKRIEQLVNSIIKNRVNKQKISGGPIVQVSNFGTSKQLHIRFNDKQGNLMPTQEEYEAQEHDKSYKEYCAENQAGIAHFEIFAPIGMKKLFDKFKNPDGSINLEAVEKCDPELLKVITGRIPNEDKYSIAHGKIVGFMPALAGDAIMFPYELTEIDDSDFDVDKRYTMRKVMDIVEDTGKIRKSLYNRVVKSYRDTHNGEISYSKKKELNDAANMLLDNPKRMKDTDALMASLYQEYQKILREEYPYKTRYPRKGTRDANNNQIIDMSWAVMSNEMTADKILNPGGFEIPKHTAYVIAAYRNSDGTISWEQLEGMSTKELQKLASSEKDLGWFDDHVQFYKQNAAGSNLIGVFAVNKVAHATLEGDGLLINIEDFCGEKPFTIADMEFQGMMPVDDAFDTKGMRIGKNIGSGIGASADTAKDPWLDSININMTTAGMFNALLRMGMPMADAELFMAQDVILRMMNEFNRKSLENKGTTLDKIIQDRIDTIKKKNEYTEESEINVQPLTRDELKEGLIPIKGNISQEREAIEYKTLLAYQKVKTLAKAIRKPTFVTRLNSVSAAVGPLIIDNIILEHKLNSFLQIEDEDTTGFYTKNPDGTFSPVDMDDILHAHPILKEFSKPIDSRNPDCPSRIMFSDMPAGSNLFKAILKALPSNIDTKIYDDRQLLSKLSDFFQSYLLVANNVIKPKELKYYIEEFPKEFAGIGKDKNIKEQYSDNVFVQAVQLNYEKKSQRAFLNINTTGMKEQEKERLRMGWTDLHKINPELSTKLFTYAFFRGGIGFSPKTFMGLVPTYVKEHLTGYIDTYRHFPKVMEDTIIEQFIRNNWDNSTLVPRKGGEGTNYEVDLDNGTLIVRDEKDKKDLQGIKFMKTVVDKETYLWKLLGTEDTNKRERYYIRIYPLGNNGEYVEMSTLENMQAFSKTTELIDNTETTELSETSPVESEAADVDTPTSVPESDSQQSKTLSDLVPSLMRLDTAVSPSKAQERLEMWAKKVKEGTVSNSGKKFLMNLLNTAGVKASMDDVIDKFKEFC